MIDLLEEIDSTSSSQAARPPSPVSPQGSPIIRHRPRPQQPSFYQPESTNVNLNGLSLAPATRYSEEMDWAPTTSRYPAFNAASASAPRPQPQDPFRARVPAEQPTPLAAMGYRSFNHPTTSLFPGAPPPPPRGAGGMFGRLPTHTSRHQHQQQHQEEEEEEPEPLQYQPQKPHQPVQFRDAQFFNPTRDSDPRNSLSDMFSTSFNVADSQAGSPPKKATAGWGGLSSFASALALGSTRREKEVSPPPRQIEAALAPAPAPTEVGVGGFPVGALRGETGRETRAQRARREARQGGSFGRGF